MRAPGAQHKAIEFPLCWRALLARLDMQDGAAHLSVAVVAVRTRCGWQKWRN